jgi:hypothetical protein
MVLATAWLALHLSKPKLGDTTVLHDVPEIKANVALIETGGSHDEVVAAIYHALGSLSGVYTSMYLGSPRFGIENVYAWIKRRYRLSPYDISRPYDLRPDSSTSPDVIILATCEHDVYAVDTALHYYYANGLKTQNLLCVMHHVDRFNAVEEHVRRWARAGRLQFITLSPHTTKALREETRKYDPNLYDKVKIDTFPPVFPAPLTPNPAPSDRLTIAIQGTFQDSRRDYLQTLLDFERMIDELPAPIVSRLQFVLAGHGKQVGVPAKILPYVSVNFSLDYISYYNLLHEAFALIPAFADEGYYALKASSSVPASFIANTPLLGSKRLVESYGYLSESSIWPIEVGEGGEIHAVYEILRGHFDDNGLELSSWKTAIDEKRRAVRKRALELMGENTKLMQEIVFNQGS